MTSFLHTNISKSDFFFLPSISLQSYIAYLPLAISPSLKNKSLIVPSQIHLFLYQPVLSSDLFLLNAITFQLPRLENTTGNALFFLWWFVNLWIMLKIEQNDFMKVEIQWITWISKWINPSIWKEWVTKKEKICIAVSGFLNIVWSNVCKTKKQGQGDNCDICIQRIRKCYQRRQLCVRENIHT